MLLVYNNLNVMFSAFFVFVVLCSVQVNGKNLENKEIQVEPQPLSLTYLGNVGTKQFFVGDSLLTWQDAWSTCLNSGLWLARLMSDAEYNFIVQQLMVNNQGPFWLGARDLGNRSIFRWSQFNPPYPDDPDTLIGDFIYYYNYVEQGPLGLQMNKDVGPAVFGAHSFLKSAKALCQAG